MVTFCSVHLRFFAMAGPGQSACADGVSIPETPPRLMMVTPLGVQILVRRLSLKLFELEGMKTADPISKQVF